MEGGNERPSPPPSRWDVLNPLRSATFTKSGNLIKDILKISPLSLIYRKLDAKEEEEEERDEDDEGAAPGVYPLAPRRHSGARGGLVELKLGTGCPPPKVATAAEDEDESSDEELERLQHTAGGGAGTAVGTAGGQPHQWEKTDFATFTWCKYCGKHLFPISSGFTCKRGCNYTVHKGKCMEAASKFECYAADAQNRSRQESHLDTFHNQVAGHKGKAAFLKDLDGGKILKPLCPVEFQFYSLLAKLACPGQHEAPGISREEFDAMRSHVKDSSLWETFFPRFYGAAQTSESDDSVMEHYIVMEDLTAGYSCPCVCDLKIGARGYDERASTKKILQQKLLCSVTTSSTLCFRLCGMQYWQSERRSYVVRDKLWGCKLKDNTMQGALVQFLDNGDGVRFPLILNWLPKMKQIEKWFEQQTLFTFYSSSLLLIYEGSAPRDCTDQQVLKADVRMIDFAHTHPIVLPGATRDENYLSGLRSVIRMLEDILRPVLTPEMLEQLGYNPSAHSNSRSGDDESPLSGTFDIRHLFHRRRAARILRSGDATEEAGGSVNVSGSDGDTRYVQLEDSEESEESVEEVEDGGEISRVASAPHSLFELGQQHDDETKMVTAVLSSPEGRLMQPEEETLERRRSMSLSIPSRTAGSPKTRKKPDSPLLLSTTSTNFVFSK